MIVLKVTDKRDGKVWHLNFNEILSNDAGEDLLYVGFGRRLHDDYCVPENVEDFTIEVEKTGGKKRGK